jgi:hypothetical protein
MSKILTAALGPQRAPLTRAPSTTITKTTCNRRPAALTVTVGR